MKRFKVLGLALVAVFALSALIASAASAALPEYAICAKAEPKNTGNYTAKTCEAASKVAGTGKYEIVLGTSKAKKLGIKGKNIGTPKNNIVNPFGEKKGGPSEPGKIEGTTECTKEKIVGETLNGKQTTWKTEYKKCKGNGVPCNTTGQKAETIITDQLTSNLVNLDKATPHKRAGIEVTGGGPGGRLAQYECPTLGINIEVFGAALAEVTGNLNTANKKTVAKVKEGPLKLQSDLYVEEAFSEEQGKEFFETAFAFEACEKGEAPFPPGPHSHAECEGFGLKFKEAQPTSLISVVTGTINAKAPATQNGETENKGEAFLIADN